MSEGTSTVTIDKDLYRGIFRRHAAGVAVITFDGGNGPSGFTATSVGSLSMTPPLVGFAIADTASAWPHLREASNLVVNFLDQDQQDLAQQFATSGIDRFAPPLPWRRLDTGEPLLTQSRRWFRGRIELRQPMGDHHLIIVEIEEIHISPEDNPSLVYYEGTYHSLSPQRMADLIEDAPEADPS